MDFSPFQQVKLIFVKHEKYGNSVYISDYQNEGGEPANGVMKLPGRVMAG